jgi:hypothetical protein
VTPFAFLVFGFVAAVIVHAVRNQSRHPDTQRAYPPESDGIDLTWQVTYNDGRPLEQRFIEAVDVALWETELWREGEDA